MNWAESLWCTATPPDSASELPVILAALGRMRRIGGVCASLAALIDDLLARHRVRMFDPGDEADVGAVAAAGDGPYLLISRDFVTRFPDADHRSGNIDTRGIGRPETLQLILAHEADHFRGADHTDTDGFLTPNSIACSDLR